MKSPGKILVTIGLLTAAMSGCAPLQPTADVSPLQHELGQLRQQQQQQGVQIEQNNSKLLQLETKLQEQQALIGELRQELATKKVTPPREIAASSKPVFAPAAPPAGADSQNGSPTDIYLKAFSDYAAGRFEPATQGFETFLRLYADSDYAGNAQYWLGECYYSQQQYDRAIEEFQRTVERYPQGSKTPDALLKMSSALTQLGQTDRAEEALKALRSRYPDSPAARRSLGAN